MTAPTRRASRCSDGRCRHRAPSPICAPRPATRRSASGLPVRTGRERGRHQRDAARQSRHAVQRREPSPAMLLLMCGGWTPSVHLFSQSRAQAAVRRALAGVPAGRMDRAGALAPAPATARSSLAACLEEGYAAGEQATRCAPHDARRSRQRRPCRSLPAPAARHSSISRTTSPPRTSHRTRRRASARSSTSSATPRPAWRPTRARRRT